MDERDAVARLRQGDIGGLEELVRLYQVQALRATYLVTRDRQLAEDVVQAGFLKAYERIGQFDMTRPFGPWFLRSLINAAIKAAVRAERTESFDRQPRVRIESLTERDGRVEPEAAFEQAETRQAVLSALTALSPMHRAVIVLRYYLDMSEADIAQRLDVPRGTVKRRLHDARERLRGLLNRDAVPQRPLREDQHPCERT
jgi:RNA polymerase sigma-70 factor (ECF subfamily)